MSNYILEPAAQKPAVVLVHGAFAESASWNGVIEKLQANAVRTMSVANPLRSTGGSEFVIRSEAVAASILQAVHAVAG